MSTLCDLTHKQAEDSLASCKNAPQELYWQVLQHAVQCRCLDACVPHCTYYLVPKASLVKTLDTGAKS